MKIAIAGCGIAGTTTATFLSQNGHDVTIFEQADKCQPIGAGIMLQPSGQEVLRHMGLLNAAEGHSARLEGLDASLKSGRPLLRLRYDVIGPETSALGVHRGRLFVQLLEACRTAGARVVTATRIERYQNQSDCVKLFDSKGKCCGDFDFIVAADGGRSLLRKQSGIRYHEVRYPYGALWTTGPCSQITTCLHQVIDGTQRLVGLLPIGKNQAGQQECSFFWGLHSSLHEELRAANFETWKQEAVSFCPEASELLETIHSFEQMTFARYQHVRMQKWHAERIVFIGDAAHPSSPHLGQGINLALEGAREFAVSLDETGDFAEACRLYQTHRQRKIRYYQQLTRLLTPFFQSDVPFLATARNLALPWLPSIPLIRTRMIRTLCGMSNGWVG